MSGLIKSLKKGVQKVFKFVRKAVKTITQSKVFKAVALAAAVYFTAGAVAGVLAPTATAAATAAPLSVAQSASMAFNGAGAAATGAATGAAAGAASGTLSGTLAGNIAGTLMKGVTNVATMAKNNPLITSSLMNAGGQIVAGMSQSRQEQKAYDRDRKDLEQANATQLPVAQRLGALNEKYGVKPKSQSIAPDPSRSLGSYYDTYTDSYKDFT